MKTSNTVRFIYYLALTFASLRLCVCMRIFCFDIFHSNLSNGCTLSDIFARDGVLTMS